MKVTYRLIFKGFDGPAYFLVLVLLQEITSLGQQMAQSGPTTMCCFYTVGFVHNKQIRYVRAVGMWILLTLNRARLASCFPAFGL